MSTERVDYSGEGLAESAVAATPLAQIRQWLDAAAARQANDGDVPEPMSLSVATVDATGAPNVRTVLLRVLDTQGLGFFTNTGSAKGLELAANPAVAASLTWAAMFRAVRVRGRAEQLPEPSVAVYFQERPWASRISAWASRQSQPVADRAALETAYERFAVRFPDRGRPDDVPVPPHWGGFRIRCSEVEFWGGRRNRLHDRVVFTSVNGEVAALDDEAVWQVSRRQP